MVLSLAEQLVGRLTKLEPDMLRLLEKLVTSESPSDVPESQAPVLETIGEALALGGHETVIVRRNATGGHLLSRARPPGCQLLVGHCDTVWPLGSLARMPFTVSNGRIRGPGVFDTKAGLTQLVFALRALRSLQVDLPAAPVVFVNSDEEIGSPESTPHIRRLAATAVRAFVLEPSMGSSGRLKTRRKGGGSLAVVVRGRAAHAGLGVTGGASAVLELAHLVQRLHALNDLERGVTVNVGVIEGGIRSNVIAPEGRALVDVRATTEADGARVERAIRQLQPVISGVRIEVNARPRRPPMQFSARNHALWKVACAAGRELGLRLQECLAPGMSDGNTTSRYTATLDGLGAVGDGAHADHEFVYQSRLVERAALLALLLAAPLEKLESTSPG